MTKTQQQNEIFEYTGITDFQMQKVILKALRLYEPEFDYKSQNYKKRHTYRQAIKCFAGLTPSDITWSLICNMYANDDTSNHNKHIRIAVVAVMLEENLYSGEDREYLLELLPYFRHELSLETSMFAQTVSISDASRIIVASRHREGKEIYRVYEASFSSAYIKSVVTAFLYTPVAFNSKHGIISTFISIFENSLGNCIVNTIEDFSEITFWNQEKYVESLYSGSEFLSLVDTLIMFYRFILNNAQKDIFENARSLSETVIKSNTVYEFIRDTPNFSEKNIYVFHIRNQLGKTLLLNLDFNNVVIKEEFVSFMDYYLDQKARAARDVLISYASVFETSLGDYIDLIHTYEDFDEKTLWAQINYYRKLFNKTHTTELEAINFVLFFYRQLVNNHPEYPFFKEAKTISKYLLFNGGLSSLICENCTFMYYDPQNSKTDCSAEKVVFILNGYNKLYTRFQPEDYARFDLSAIRAPEYRNLLIRYIISAPSRLSELYSNHSFLAREILAQVISIKNKKGYPNPNLLNFTDQEAVLIRKMIHNEKVTLQTLNNKIGSIRRFLQWASERNLITISSMFFDYLRQYEEPSRTVAKPIPDKDLIILNKYLSKRAKPGTIEFLYFTIFHLLIQTEFRISQICQLRADCIKPSVKPDQYYVVSNSKTSHGAKKSYVITGYTFYLLSDAINDTEPLRDQCTIESIKDCIFLYYHKNDNMRLITQDQFGNYMERVCNECGLPRYRASNLRDTHMTKAFEHILRTGKSDLEMRVLSKHKRIDTTKSHYIAIELEKMLESTYQVMVDDGNHVDVDDKVIPESQAPIGKQSLVENGCGHCKTQTCISRGSLPCLLCKDFVTTVKHEKDFIRMIDITDHMISEAHDQHDKDDLTTIKSLYVQYLKAIYLFKEQNNGN